MSGWVIMCLQGSRGICRFAGRDALGMDAGWAIREGIPQDMNSERENMSEEDEMVELVTTSSTGHRFAFGAHVDEITYESLTANDEILIQTANSRYRFSVVDPAHHRGLLTGGSLGDRSYEVTFAGSLQEEKGRDLSEVSKLRTNTRALFYIESPNGLKRMITSRITNLSLLRGRSC